MVSGNKVQDYTYADAQKEDNACPAKSDEQYRKLIVGKWSSDETNIDFPGISSEETRRANGTLQLQIYFPKPQGRLIFILNGTWSIKDGILNEKTTDTDNTIMDLQTKDKILCLNDKRMVLKSLDNGEIQKRHKII